MLLFVGVLVFGLLMLASASWPLGFDRFYGNGYYFLVHQLLFGVLPGVVGFIVAYLVPHQSYRRLALPMLAISVFLLIIVFIPGLGVEIKGSHSWISLGAFSYQPSELVKFTFLIYLAAWLEGSMGKNVRDTAKGLLPFLTVLGLVNILEAARALDVKRVVFTSAKGVYGPVCVDAWNGKDLPYVEGTVNLLVIDDGQKVAPEEIERVLALAFDVDWQEARAELQRLRVRMGQRIQGDTAMHLQGAHGGDDDNGRGIEEKDHQRIFDLFRRAGVQDRPFHVGQFPRCRGDGPAGGAGDANGEMRRLHALEAAEEDERRIGRDGGAGVTGGEGDRGAALALNTRCASKPTSA